MGMFSVPTRVSYKKCTARVHVGKASCNGYVE